MNRYGRDFESGARDWDMDRSRGMGRFHSRAATWGDRNWRGWDQGDRDGWRGDSGWLRGERGIMPGERNFGGRGMETGYSDWTGWNPGPADRKRGELPEHGCTPGPGRPLRPGNDGPRRSRLVVGCRVRGVSGSSIGHQRSVRPD